jgi:hypothetical protein
MLFEAMQYLDPVTSQPRGFLRMSAAPLQGVGKAALVSREII